MPTRISTFESAQRVQGEADSAQLGQHSVGHYTSLNKSDIPQSMQDIAFVTHGLAVAQMLGESAKRKEQADITSSKKDILENDTLFSNSQLKSNKNNKTLLVIDEVHMMSNEIEYLLALAYDKLNSESIHYDENFHVVIMSATINTEELNNYFGTITEPSIIKLHVPMYTVERSESDSTVEKVAVLEAKLGNKVLAFMPTIRGIKNAIERVRINESAVSRTKKGQKNRKIKSKITLTALHGKQTREAQQLAFEEFTHGGIVFATNAAESSLTVPSTRVVVDSGQAMVGSISYETIDTGTEKLTKSNVSRAEIDQRAGRVGRESRGCKHILCSVNGVDPVVRYNDRQKFATPSIHSTRLDNIVLLTALNGETLNDRTFLHKPPEVAVRASMKRLWTLGALDNEGGITEKGVRMAKYPLDPELAAMIVFAEQNYSSAVTANIIDIVAIVQSGGVVSRNPKEDKWKLLLTENRKGGTEYESDFIAQLDIYHKLRNGFIDEKEWEANDINLHSMHQIEDIRKELYKRSKIGIGDVSRVHPKRRREVLTCINSGQLNQLWFKNGSNWSPVYDPTQSFKLAESSVVLNSLSKIVTGKMFTLDIGDKVYESIQDVNTVTTDSLKIIADHLIDEKIDPKSLRYDPNKLQVMVTNIRTLGAFALNAVEKSLDVHELSIEDRIAYEKSVTKKIKNQWRQSDSFKKNRKEPLTADYFKSLQLDEIEPELIRIGTNPLSNKEIVMWLGGKGNWCDTKEIAINSILSRYKDINTKKIPRKLKKELEKANKAKNISN